MSTSQASLDAASVDRKARLAKLASLKRKRQESEPQQPEPPAADESATTTTTDFNIKPQNKNHIQNQNQKDQDEKPSDAYISGRNFDLETRGPKLGFENDPSSGQSTLEARAAAVDLSTAEQARKDEEAAEKAIDLFKLQPRRPNWDLKRNLEEKMTVLNVRTQNAIARLVRERIEKAKQEAKTRSDGGQVIDQRVKGGAGGGEEEAVEVGMEGNTLVEGVHLRERQEQEEERRERETNEEDGMA